jgi:hypothetical protein
MGHLLESISDSDSFFEFIGETFINLHDRGARHANQVMTMSIVSFGQQAKPGAAVAKIEAFYHAFPLQHVHRPINGGQIANAVTKGGKDLPRGHWE